MFLYSTFPFDVSLVFKIKINLVAKNILCKKCSAICAKQLGFCNLCDGCSATPKPGVLGDHLSPLKTLPENDAMVPGLHFKKLFFVFFLNETKALLLHLPHW